MEDVVLHYRSGPAGVSLVQQLLEPFPLRPPPAFRPWFPPRNRLPLRPARPAPAVAPEPEPGTPEFWVPETPDLVPETREGDRVQDQDPPPRRSWSVSVQRGLPGPASPSPSRSFGRVMSLHKLLPLQRARWTIRDQNCRDLEKVWRCLSRCVRGARLPTCNANIQRPLAEIWVFCDVVYAEQVGRFLKEELRLRGGIELSVQRRGSVFSM
ncbi:shieldin complex subunit 3 [Cololabis saira]|uniref:shieldin complex subunit 3 n=1 Tax=Cololabis saira TaxID=129043 RepID=UPI002AD48B90|nr:shieldin complex subunit 3 [Cololabis saira]XP_061585761.1 shieldin complex subunit 3 [Cololabis saira]